MGFYPNEIGIFKGCSEREIFKSKGRNPIVGGLGALWSKLQQGPLVTSAHGRPWAFLVLPSCKILIPTANQIMPLGVSFTGLNSS